MATTLNVIKTITIRGSAEGVAEVERQLAGVAAGMEQVTIASGKQEKATLSVEAAYKKLQTRYDQEFRAQQNLAQVQKILAQAQEQGLVSQTRASDLMQRAVFTLNQTATGSKAARFELINLSRQIQDVGVSLASGQSPFTVLIQQGSQIGDVFASSQLTMRQWAERFFTFFTPARLAILGFTAAVGALAFAWIKLRDTGPDVEATFKIQTELLSVVQKAYKDATKAAGEFLEQSKAVTQAKALDAFIDAQKILTQATAAIGKATTTPTSVPSEIPIPFGVQAIENATQAASKFRELTVVIDRFNQSAKTVSDVKAYRDALADIRVTAEGINQPLADEARALLKSSEEAGNAALLFEKLEAILAKLAGTATETQNKLLGLAATLKPDAFAQFVQRTQDAIEVRRLEVQEIGKSEGAVKALRIQNEANRIAKEKGIEIDQKVVDGLKRDAAAAEDAFTAGKKVFDQAEKIRQLREDLARETASLFLSKEDQQIAERLKDLPNALNSAEAAQIRFNNRVREAQDLTSDFLNTFVQGMVSGKSATDALSSALKSLGQAISSSAIKDIGTSLSKAIAGGGTGSLLGAGGGGLFGGLLGGALGGPLAAAGIGVGISLIGKLFEDGEDSNKAAAAAWQAAAQQAEEAARALEAAQARARGFEAAAETTLLDTNTLEGALKAFEVRAYTARFEEAKAGGQAMGNLEKSLAIERFKIINEFAEQVLRRQESFQDRLFQATTDTSTLEGQLAQFDRQAQREREAEIRTGGEAIVELEAALAAERTKIVKDFNDQALEEQREANDRQLEEQKRFNSIASGIVDFVKGLFTSESAGGSPTDRLRHAQANYEQTLTLARQGNEEALDRITAEAETYRQTLRAVYGSTLTYQQGVQQIADDLLSLPTVQDSTDQIVNAIRDSIIILENIDATLSSQQSPSGSAVVVTAAQKGGWVNQGVPWRDSALVFASRDEFVVNNASARRYGGLLEAINTNSLGAGGGSGDLVTEIRALRSDIMRGFVVSSENVREGVDEVASAMTIVAREAQLKQQTPAM
jgi:Prophage tail length tape measure protein